jgi:hypothetical protein
MATVRGAFATREQAAAAVDRLISEGFEAGQVSVLDSRGELAEVTPEGGPLRTAWLWGAIGAVVGALLWATGGAGLTPGLSGPASVLPGLVLGAVVGGLLGLYAGRRLSPAEVERDEERTAAGAYVVAVEAARREEARARTVLATAGAETPARERAAGAGG